MRKTIITFCFVIMSLLVVAQQDPQFTQNMFNHIATNPGYAGSLDMVNISAIHRQNWLGFMENNMMTSVLNINTPLGLEFLKNSDKDKRDQIFTGGGTGFTIMQDQIGELNNLLSFKGSFSARFKAGDGNISFGVEAGLLNNTPKSITWITPDGNSNDDALPTTFDPVLSFDLGAGIFYYSEKVYFGISASHLLKPVIIEATNPTTMNIHYFLTSGYNLQMGDSPFEMIPSVFIETDITTTQINVNANFRYNKKIWAGVSYKIDDAIAFMAGMEIFEGFLLGYSFDWITSSIATYSSGSHEFLLSYSFSLKKEKAPQKYKSVRFL